MMSLSAVIYREEDMYVAKCPEVGTISQGKTIEESLNNLKEATELYLEEFPFKENGKPIMTIFEVVGNAKA
ncbi:MAG: type II toxin-antitoxin system HicB family antitoxin [Candidatus Aenigmarchaeota archaeon]|nr:type II toxin-antitoxin system HicB family antitoxin [Candidatus Aenigmarchaeota archaeon]